MILQEYILGSLDSLSRPPDTLLVARFDMVLLKGVSRYGFGTVVILLGGLGTGG